MKIFSLVYRDSDLIVIDKPQGLPTTPGTNPSLCELVFEDIPLLAIVDGYRKGEGGLLNRLDNETGGLVMFAASNESFIRLSEMMKAGRIKKQYHAIVDGLSDQKKGTVNRPIAHHPTAKKRMVIADIPGSIRGIPRDAKTKWRLLATGENRSLLQCEIIRGARHQIRVHLASIGLPINGDKIYNKSGMQPITPFHMLYAVSLEINYGKETEPKVISVPSPFPDRFSHQNL